MNKEEIIKILKKYNFNKDKYIVISGAAMVLQVIENIKVQDANDILKLKQKLKREKDISDIKLLNSYISRNNI